MGYWKRVDFVIDIDRKGARHDRCHTHVRRRDARDDRGQPRHGLPADDATAVAELDMQYQRAVKNNDAATMDRILADDFVLVTGRGKAATKADLLKEARSGAIVYEHQEDTEQRVRVWGDTAVVTALLWVKGIESGKAFDYKLWFSDTYVRTPSGWRYVFGQASLPLPSTK